MSQKLGLILGLRVVRSVSSSSQRHLISTSGLPNCVPTAMYSMLSPGSQEKGVVRSKRNRPRILGSAERTPKTMTFLRPSWCMENSEPFLVQTESPHGALSGGFDESAMRLASLSCSTCARNASADSCAASSCDLSVAFVSSARRASASYFSCAAFALLASFIAVITHPATEMASVTTQPMTTSVVVRVQAHGSAFIDSSPNCSARTSQMRDDTDSRRGPGGSPNAARHHTRQGGA